MHCTKPSHLRMYLQTFQLKNLNIFTAALAEKFNGYDNLTIADASSEESNYFLSSILPRRIHYNVNSHLLTVLHTKTIGFVNFCHRNYS